MGRRRMWIALWWDLHKLNLEKVVHFKRAFVLPRQPLDPVVEYTKSNNTFGIGMMKVSSCIMYHSEWFMKIIGLIYTVYIYITDILSPKKYKWWQKLHFFLVFFFRWEWCSEAHRRILLLSICLLQRLDFQPLSLIALNFQVNRTYCMQMLDAVP